MQTHMVCQTSEQWWRGGMPYHRKVVLNKHANYLEPYWKFIVREVMMTSTMRKLPTDFELDVTE